MYESILDQEAERLRQPFVGGNDAASQYVPSTPIVGLTLQTPCALKKMEEVNVGILKSQMSRMASCSSTGCSSGPVGSGASGCRGSDTVQPMLGTLVQNDRTRCSGPSIVSSAWSSRDAYLNKNVLPYIPTKRPFYQSYVPVKRPGCAGGIGGSGPSCSAVAFNVQQQYRINSFSKSDVLPACSRAPFMAQNPDEYLSRAVSSCGPVDATRAACQRMPMPLPMPMLMRRPEVMKSLGYEQIDVSGGGGRKAWVKSDTVIAQAIADAQFNTA
jgi:hypothetical protein